MNNKSVLIAIVTIFITMSCGVAQTTTVTDIDGNIYHTVNIGTQTWMVENLRTTRCNDGTPLSNITGDSAWEALTTQGYCWYNNDSAKNSATYGALYNWWAVNSGKLAPEGWHVPADSEWFTMVDYLIIHGYNYDGSTNLNNNKLGKALASATGWAPSALTGAVGNTDYPAKRNASGFTALPGGYRTGITTSNSVWNLNTFGYHGIDTAGLWWINSHGNYIHGYSGPFYYAETFGITYNTNTAPESGTINNMGTALSVRCVKNLKASIIITSPALGETVLANSKYNIKWESTGVDSVKIEYSLDDGNSFNGITPGIPADADSFSWNVPDTLSAKCRLRLTNLDDASDTAVLSNFRIKGYVLTRMKTNGDYEAFDPAVHGWQFGNYDSVMWPDTWYNRFFYRGTDPNTGLRYPPYFTFYTNNNTMYGIDALSSNFPDWPLWSQTFGTDQCYMSITTPIYSPLAVRYWGYVKKAWNGSCYGFAISSLLEFDFSNAFRASFPQLGSYTNLIELPINDYNRSVINQLYIYQYGIVQMDFDDKIINSSPRATLQNAKDNFMSTIQNHSALTIIAQYTLNGGKHGGHTMLPYALKRIPNNPGQYELLVYDSRCPSGNCDDNSKPAILIDSLQNYWSYPSLGWNSGNSSQGMYFTPLANTFLQRPIIPYKDTLRIKAKVWFMDKDANNINIINTAGNTIGFNNNTTVNTIPGGYAIPNTGISDTTYAPIGYILPAGSYSVNLNSFQDSVTSIGVFGSSSVFSYWRGDAVHSQTDLLTYNGGLVFRNPDAQTKNVNLEVITNITACESGFQFLNCPVGKNDSVLIETTADNHVALVNMGPAKKYDLNIVKACDSLSGQYYHDSITLPANSTHIIYQGLPDLTNNMVKIYEDRGNTGSISDSLIVMNQFTGISNSIYTVTDGNVSILQNYPNPFQSATTIKFRVKDPGFVSLKVFDITGTEIACLLNEQKTTGDYTLYWNASGIKGGIYFCRLQTGSFSKTIKLVKFSNYN